MPEVVVDLDPDGFDVDHRVWDRAGWLDELREIPVDGWWPRLMTVPHPRAIGSLGDEFCAWVQAEHGHRPRWWQRLVAARMLEHDADGWLVWPEIYLSVARQSGKSWLVSWLCDWRSEQAARFGEPQLVMHTADTILHAFEVQALCRDRAYRHGWEVRLAQGSQAIFKGSVDGKWLIRSQGTVQGSAVSLAVVDEAQGVKVETVTERLEPTMLERSQTQMLLVSTAMASCTELMPMRRTDALTGLVDPTGLLMLEWSASPELALGDPVSHRQASPYWHKGREDKITRAAQAALAMPEGHEVRRGFCCQYRNEWPRSDSRGPGEPLLPRGAWARAVGSVDPVGGGWCAVEDFAGPPAVAFAIGDGDGCFELDAAWADSRTDALGRAQLALDKYRGSKLIVGANMRTEESGKLPANVRLAGGRETRRALSLLRSLVAEGKVRHQGTFDLDEQIEAARVRLVDGGLTLTGPRSDLLRAALWALWFAQKPPPSPRVA